MNHKDTKIAKKQAGGLPDKGGKAPAPLALCLSGSKSP
jgi:hypothetical protein